MKNEIAENATRGLFYAINSINDNEHTSIDKFIKNLDQKTLVDLANEVRLELVEIFCSVIELTEEDKKKAIGELFPEILENVSKSIAKKVLEVELLNYELKTSYLTKLPNQRAGAEFITELIETNHPFAWTFFDLDRLKSLNLAYGEHVVDRLIRSVGDRLGNNIRQDEVDGKNDMIIHRSGDEFWLILNHADFRGGMIASNKLLKSINTKPIVIKLNESDADYLKNIQLSLKKQLTERNNLDGFESIALSMANEAIVQINAQELAGTAVSKRASDQGKKVYFIKVPVTASMGCTAFSTMKGSNLGSEDWFEEMASRIKFAEEKAKQSGRNCVRGFDGKNYYILTGEKKLKII